MIRQMLIYVGVFYLGVVFGIICIALVSAGRDN